MTRWIWIVALAACSGDGNDGNAGTDAAGSGSGSGSGSNALACNAVTSCSTWSADDVDVAAPTERGGTIPDGIYRVERGTFDVGLLQFAGNRFNDIGDSFENDTGTYTTANGLITFNYEKQCNKMGTIDDAGSWKDRPYWVNGDTLLVGMADSSTTGVVWYEYKKIPVDQICTANAYVKCRVTNCSCAVVTNGFGTVMSGIKSCSSS